MNQRIYIVLLALLFVFSSCNDKKKAAVGDNGAYYTCPMHPTVKSTNPGSCPVCNMSLVKVEKQQTEHIQQKGNFITIDKRQQVLAGIKIDTVKQRIISPEATILGTVVKDDEEISTINSRVKGRIDKLYFKSSGEFIKKGTPVYTIYSEQLLADEKEYLVLLDNKKDSQSPNKYLDDMLLAAKSKLMLWGLTDNQINALKKNKTATPQLTYYSQTEGYISEVLVKEGSYVEEGTILLKLTSLKSVWIEAQVYADEIEKIKGIKSFQVFTESYPTEVFTGNLVFYNPSINETSKVQMLRLKIANSQNKFIPGMMVYVSPKQNSKVTLVIPKSAVLLEKMKTVWVLAHDTTFEQRMVQTGIENNHWVEITSGINEGEIIVTEGAYLINSEFILKNGKGNEHGH